MSPQALPDQTANYTLLIVDDEKQNRILLLELLRHDYQIILAKDGRQGLELARQHQPDLVLLDVLMPELDGYATLAAMRGEEATRHIPVIFITALDSGEDEARGLELGAADYIAKPFHPAIVRARIRNHLQIVDQRRQLEQLTLIDSLTEIPNRRRFVQVMEQEWRRCRRKASPLSLVVADVDHFKYYNDTLGHAAGDKVLQQVAACMASSLRRAGDFVARYGGEEFALVLPECQAKEAQALIERIRSEMEALRVPHPASPVSPWVTVSLGGATLVPDVVENDGQLFALADEALYQAKRNGRNRVAWSVVETLLVEQQAG